MAKNTHLRDVAVSHAIGIRRLSTSVVKKIVGVLDDAEGDLVGQLEKYAPHDVSSRYQRQRITKLLAAIKSLNKDVYKQVGQTLKAEMIDAAKFETEYQIKALGGTLAIGAGEFTLPSRAVLVAAATEEPFAGRLLSEWVDGLAAGRFDRLRSAIRMSVVQGESVADLVKRIRGTRSLGYKDGILQTSRRSAEAMARTALNHVTSSAQQATYEENADLLEGWRWVATLENNTCDECAALDGQVFDVGDIATPPRHINCRCTTAPVVKYGGDTEKITYQKWLANQSAEVQDQALGPTRGKLFREGGLTVQRFVDDLGRGLTLDQLRQIEPQAFTDAGIDE